MNRTYHDVCRQFIVDVSIELFQLGNDSSADFGLHLWGEVLHGPFFGRPLFNSKLKLKKIVKKFLKVFRKRKQKQFILRVYEPPFTQRVAMAPS